MSASQNIVKEDIGTTINTNNLAQAQPHSVNIEEFLNLIKNCEFEKSQVYLEKNSLSINKNYVDNNGNTVMHIIIKSLLNKLTELSTECGDFQGFRYNSKKDKQTRAKKTNDESEKIINEFYLVLDTLLKLKFPFDLKNKAELIPGHLFRDTSINWCYKNAQQIEKYVIEKFIEHGNFLYAGRKYVSNLACYRGSKKPHKVCEIPDRSTFLNQHDNVSLTLHQRLEVIQKHYSISDSSFKNIVAVNIGFLISDLLKANESHKPIFVSLPLYDDKYQIIRSKQHSEDGFYDYLCDENNLKLLINQFKRKYPEYFRPGHKIYAVIIDIASTREVCLDCEKILYNLQTRLDKKSFLGILESLLGENGYLIPKKAASRFSPKTLEEDPNQPKLKVIIRASGFEDPSWYGNQSSNHPMPIVVFAKKEHKDIRFLEPKTMFHLVPKNSIFTFSSLIFLGGADNENEKMKSLYDSRSITSLRSDTSLQLYPCTVFGNRGNDRIPIQHVTRKNGELLLLKYESLSKNNYYQLSFEDDIINKDLTKVEKKDEYKTAI